MPNMPKIYIFLIAMASLNWWIFLITRTWFDRRPEGDVVTANALTSLAVFAVGVVGLMVITFIKDNDRLNAEQAARRNKT